MLESILDLITRLKSETRLDEYQLWKLVESGFSSYWKRGGRATALGMDDVVALRRAAKKENAWALNGNSIPMEDWLREVSAWQT